MHHMFSSIRKRKAENEMIIRGFLLGAGYEMYD